MTLDLRGINYKLTADTQSGVVGINAATEALKRADVAAVRTSGAFLQFGKQGELTARQMQALSYQTTDIITSLASGQSPFLVLLQQGGQLRDQFGSVGNVMRAFAASLTVGKVATLGLAAGVGVLGLAWLRGHQETEQFNKALALTGNAAGLTQGRFDSMARSIAAATGNTIGNAREALQGLAADGQFTGGAFESAGRAALAMQRLTGGSVDDIIKRFAGLRDNVAQWAAAANRSYNFLTAAQYEQIRTLEAQGKAQDAAKVALDALSQTLEGRTVPALGALERAWQGVKNAASGSWDVMLGVGRAESLEQQLDKVRRRIADADKSGNQYGQLHVAGDRDREIDLARQIRRQLEQAGDAAQAATTTQREIEEKSKAHQEALLRIGQAGSQLALAQQQAALDARAAATDKAYRQFELNAGQFRDRMIAVERGRVDAERRDVLAQIDIERRRVVEKPADVIARDAALLGLQTKLVQVEAKRAQVNREIAEYKRAAAAPRDIIEGPQAAFRQAEIAQQAAVEAALRERTSEGEKAVRELLAANESLNVALIQDDRARGLAQIEVDAEQLRRRAQLHAATAEQRRAIDGAVAENTRLREAQLTEQLKPEWRRRLDLYADAPRHMATAFNDALNTATRASEDAWVDMVTKGEFSAKRLVQAVNEQLARIGWQKFLAEPAANLWQQLFGAILGGGAAGSAASPYGTGLGVRLGHSGGIVGAGMGGGAMRSVNPLVFAGAGRYHRGGLVSNEVPAILQRGEEVITRGDSRHRLNGGGQAIQFGPFNFNVPAGISPAAYAVAVQPALDALQAKIVSDLARPGTTAHAAARR